MRACHGHAQCLLGRYGRMFRLRPTAIVTWRIATFEYLPVTIWNTRIKKSLFGLFWSKRITAKIVSVISAINTLRNGFVTWLRLANGREPSAAEVCSLFGYFANLGLNSDPRSACKPPSVLDLTGFDRGRAMDSSYWDFSADCHVFKFDKLKNLGLISSHDSPPPSRSGARGRRRTCLREMWWLKSIEVEDKKVFFWRKVLRYFGSTPRHLLFY